jgi:hypothetical protein
MTFITVYILFRSERLSTKVKLTHLKVFISFVMTYACRACEFAVENCF